MVFFRRSVSSASTASRSSTCDSVQDGTTPRTSLESNTEHEISDSVATIRRAPGAPVLRLPIELVQHIASYLDNASVAAFCLSSRYIYYALGTERLTKYVDASKSRFEKRRTIEAVVERAFPGHWFCAWCDKFHAWDVDDIPTALQKNNKRDCTEFNSYLHDGANYTLRYHHTRLAVNRELWGCEYGIPLETFSHTHSSMAKIFKTPVPTKLNISARIAEGHFILHTSFAIILPSYAASNKNVLKHIWPTLPHILAGHRDSENGHTGLMAAIDNVLRRGWKYPFTQSCSTCATDWCVSSHEFPHATGGQVRLEMRVWRDLGSGRNPFETGWRAHGVPAAGALTNMVKMTALQSGAVRSMFESAEEVRTVATRDSHRSRSSSRARIYRSFMRRDTTEDLGSEVRRSRAGPRTWRTKSENEEASLGYEEDRLETSRNVAEESVRLAAVERSSLAQERHIF